jgi:hypothetical protein
MTANCSSASGCGLPDWYCREISQVQMLKACWSGDKSVHRADIAVVI